MKILSAGYEILGDIDGIEMLKRIERVARTCYKSEDKITETSYVKMIKALIKNGHEAMLEHESVSVKFICDRGVSHELVRHRLASFAQESTRYANYSQDKFGHEITVVAPCFWKDNQTQYVKWVSLCKLCERVYFELLDTGAKPEEARSVLPNSLKTEVVMTANLREWRHFFRLRACGVTGKPHPQMLEIAVPILKEFQILIPIIFDDLKPMEVI